MSFWDRLTAGSKPKPATDNLDYLSEALALERQGDYDAALTSYRLALRQKPNNHKVLQNMAIAYSKLGQLDEAVRCYRRALAIEPKLSGAHYGLAFLLLRRGDVSDAAFHLEAFLMDPPRSAEAERWVKHAQKTLNEMKSSEPPSSNQKLKTSEYPGILE
ncbi:MAG TPA: tetratricopeptide repeat protein [Gemmatimonadaceae bacterium]|nr:tetratricopeptide repeat protein [Gemmatimonadaceae bacterium]